MSDSLFHPLLFLFIKNRIFMSLNCKLNKNITLNQLNDDGTSSCNAQDISMGVGGIQSPILVYNISDVESLKFKDDNRADDSLEVDTINAVGQFYKIDFTSATYQEEYENHKWTHNLQLEISNITSLFEDLLSDGVNGKYLVCFRPKGSEDYRMFGWKFGASLDYSMQVSEDSLGYTVTLEDTSEYPLFTVYSDNFGSKDKTYSPIFKPLYDVYFCEQGSDGKHTGYLVAMYVVKVNASGQPLDKNNKLCQWSGLKQDAYKYSGIGSDGGYNIIGTYGIDGSFDGRPVKKLDYEKCTADVDNSIYINEKKNDTINLNSTINQKTFTIRSTDSWSMLGSPSKAVISPTNGANGTTTCTVRHNGVGGTDVVRFENNVTKETVELTVNINIIKINSEYTFPYGTTEFVLTPIVMGGSGDYTYSVSPSLNVTKDENGYLVCKPSASANEQNFTFVLTHKDDSNEVKQVKVKVLGNNTEPSWQILSTFCEIAE